MPTGDLKQHREALMSQVATLGFTDLWKECLDQAGSDSESQKSRISLFFPLTIYLSQKPFCNIIPGAQQKREVVGWTKERELGKSAQSVFDVVDHKPYLQSLNGLKRFVLFSSSA